MPIGVACANYELLLSLLSNESGALRSTLPPYLYAKPDLAGAINLTVSASLRTGDSSVRRP